MNSACQDTTQYSIKNLSNHEFEILKRAYEIQPSNYEELISLEGIGPKKIRALALISDLVYGTGPSSGRSC